MKNSERPEGKELKALDAFIAALALGDEDAFMLRGAIGQQGNKERFEDIKQKLESGDPEARKRGAILLENFLSDIRRMNE